mgnify:CR=1 FL=1
MLHNYLILRASLALCLWLTAISMLLAIEPKTVLLIEAFGDHQVANVATEVLARTIAAAVREPGLLDGRSNDVDPQWGITPFDAANPAKAVSARLTRTRRDMPELFDEDACELCQSDWDPPRPCH